MALELEEDRSRIELILLQNFYAHLPAMQALLARINEKWCYEDGMYRFYHQSFKVFGLQEQAQEIVKLLKEVAPEERGVCSYFQEITAAGTGREFKMEDNQHWMERTAPIVQAFLHAKYFLEMAVKHAELKEPPQMMPSGWAALLCLYDLR